MSFDNDASPIAFQLNKRLHLGYANYRGIYCKVALHSATVILPSVHIAARGRPTHSSGVALFLLGLEMR